MKNKIFTSIKFLLVMTLLTGILYPLVMTGISQLAFRSKANGSMIYKDGKIIGSDLIGQKFDSDRFFWSRPSASDYGAVPSAASNYGPTSDTLKKLVNARIAHFAGMNSISDPKSIPVEMIFASGSGLDPDISPVAAKLQVNRVAISRNFDMHTKELLLKEIDRLTESPDLGILGEKRINVLKLNIELDKLDSAQRNN